MPFMRPPLSKSKKVRHAPFFYLLVIGLPVIAAGVGTGYGVTSLVKARGVWLEHAAQEVAVLRLRYGDLLFRHPDLPLAEDRAPLDAFLTFPLVRQAKELAQAQSLLVEFRDRCASLVEGRTSATAAGTRRYKTFSPNGFRAFYDRLRQPDVSDPVIGAPVTGLEAADARITEAATARGYRPRVIANDSSLISEQHYQALPAALGAFHALRDAARPLGVDLGVVSAYRSVERQRQNWVSRFAELSVELHHRQIAPEEIARGEADDVVEAVLTKNAIPGYSKHHTGYTMDLTDLSSGVDFTDFAGTTAYQWVSANNFLNAKRFGFIPSYPVGASGQGPDPEPWEYVWVGEDLLREEW
jgi:LAS superfamily LD-carboxypeptidase LdcB